MTFHAGGRSPRKEQAIYDAVHEVVMQLRIQLHKTIGDGVDVAIAQAGHQAGMAAIAAYRKPVKRAATKPRKRSEW